MEALINNLTTIIEMIGVSVIVLGIVYSSFHFWQCLLRNHINSYEDMRRRMGRSILLGLEFLVAADIINTVVIELNFKSVGMLGMLVLIRTFLSFSLEVEIDGKLPWKK